MWSIYSFLFCFFKFILCVVNCLWMWLIFSNGMGLIGTFILLIWIIWMHLKSLVGCHLYHGCRISPIPFSHWFYPFFFFCSWNIYLALIIFSLIDLIDLTCKDVVFTILLSFQSASVLSLILICHMKRLIFDHSSLIFFFFVCFFVLVKWIHYRSNYLHRWVSSTCLWPLSA